jgi:hypothetical protein
VITVDGAVIAADGSVATVPGTLDAAAPGTDGGAVTTPGNCDVNDPRLGCGTAVSDTWVRYDNGYEGDRASGLLWSPVVTLSDIGGDLGAYCITLTLDGATHIFDIPYMDAVRTLAAGCDATESGGSCQVRGDETLPSQGSTCSCDSATGPHAAGGFCRTEVSSCATLWSQTYCGPNNECPEYSSWFYDASNGSVVLASFTGELAKSAKGRCVTQYFAPLP